MNHSPDGSYDLVSRPWLLARTLDGERVELSLLETFRRAPVLAGLTGDVSTQVFALVRLLLAILHSTLRGPRDVEGWQRLWAAPDLPVDDIARYLDTHRARFDLLHPETPFFQVPGLHTRKGEVSELSKLIADVPNGIPFFTTRMTRTLTLSLPEAARWLVHCHAFDPSGIRSGAVGDSRVTNGKGYPIGTGWAGRLGGVLLEGATLRETLLLNLVPRPFAPLAADPDVDLPAWERTPPGPGEECEGGRVPDGPVDLYTWQSRRIRLVPDGERVVSVLICNGERIEQRNRFTVEPQTAWRRSKAQESKPGNHGTVYMPREHNPERALWRGLPALLAKRVSSQGADAASSLRPATLEWLDALLVEEVLDEDVLVRVRAIGMSYGSQNSSTTTEIVDDALSMRAILVRQDAERLVGTVQDAVEGSESAAQAFATLAGNLAAAAGGESDGPRSRALEQVYSELDIPFRTWLGGLSSATEPLGALREWHGTAQHIISGLAQEALAGAPEVAWVGRRVKGTLVTTSLADVWFRAALWKRLRLAYPDNPRRAEAT